MPRDIQPWDSTFDPAQFNPQTYAPQQPSGFWYGNPPDWLNRLGTSLGNLSGAGAVVPFPAFGKRQFGNNPQDMWFYNEYKNKRISPEIFQNYITMNNLALPSELHELPEFQGYGQAMKDYYEMMQAGEMTPSDARQSMIEEGFEYDDPRRKYAPHPETMPSWWQGRVVPGPGPQVRPWSAAMQPQNANEAQMYQGLQAIVDQLVKNRQGYGGAGSQRMEEE
jgi:hypothetical protein